ncbi:MAG TPA: ABC transporter permease [Candidatus Butyricicoccus avistercoris]|uniref:Transport permease protein n=1 Tax=Candidatus Butyricicoccus avistercoris TaxID=2838518 RepID=A0A9D1TIN3_9FIRM|nr:ABC transporter permease [Candidatus Butyricicoccus avistercoris]
MEFKFIKKVLCLVWGIFVISATVFYFVGGEQLYSASTDSGDMVQATNEIGEMVTGLTIEQPFSFDGTEISYICLLGTDFERPIGGTMEVSLIDEKNEVLMQKDIDMGLFSQNNNIVEIRSDKPIKIIPNKQYILRIYSKDGSDGSVPSLYYGSSISLARGEAQISLRENEKAIVNGNKIDGIICYQIFGSRELWFGHYYWHIVTVFAIVLLCFSYYIISAFKSGKDILVLRLLNAGKKYRFLLQQLVSRDFKSKYKRSILGIFWSFLNPMLMMTVQYIVFSTIFKSEIENFAVYLLTGIVCYNFFSEVTNMCLTSIVGNASLITKVYIPKYIYPISRTMSSLINFALSLIPLLVVMIATRVHITTSVFVLPFAVLCLMMLSLGMGMILSCSMVFFRDTQFLWNVFNMIWMYMTPIFYPESIVSGHLSYIMKINPLYHIIRFFRTVLLNGVSPEPKAYLFCFISALIPLLFGAWIFKKSQDKFVLYL